VVSFSDSFSPFLMSTYRSSSYSHPDSARDVSSNTDLYAIVYVVAIVVLVAVFWLWKKFGSKSSASSGGGSRAPARDPPYSNTNVFAEREKRRLAAARDAPPPYSSELHDEASPFEREANAKLSKEDAAGRDYVLAIDISGSMNTEDCPGDTSRWHDAAEGAIAFAECIERLDPDGIDICLFNNKMQWFKNATAQVVRDIFANHSPNGGTLLAPVFRTALDNYFQHRTRPVTIVVVTDGCPQDKAEVMSTIVSASKRLKRADGVDADIGITFIQIGYDRHASAFLKELDDDLQSSYGCPFDIVDTVPMNEVAQRGGIKQVLINAVND
jgi:hypothetical protein